MREGGAAVRGLEQAEGVERQRQLIEVLDEALDASVDQVAGPAVVAGVDQAGDILQRPGVACPREGGTHGLARALEFKDADQQLEEDELLAGDDDVGATAAVGAEAEEVPGLVDRLGAAGQDQGPVLAQRPGVGDQAIRGGAVDLHAGNKQQVGRPAVDPGQARAEAGVPLLEHDACPLEAGRVQGRGDRPGRPGMSRLSMKRKGPSRVRKSNA